MMQPMRNLLAAVAGIASVLLGNRRFRASRAVSPGAGLGCAARRRAAGARSPAWRSTPAARSTRFIAPSRRSSSSIAAGKILKMWGEKLFAWPHGIRIDRFGNLWITDGQARNGIGQQVFKYSPDGTLLMTLGTKGVRGEGPDTFGGPCDVAVAPNGDIFVADGHFNSRIVKFDKDGKFIKAWGKRGERPGEFNLPHTSSSIRAAACWSAIARTTASRSSIRTAPSSISGRSSARRAGCTSRRTTRSTSSTTTSRRACSSAARKTAR